MMERRAVTSNSLYEQRVSHGSSNSNSTSISSSASSSNHASLSGGMIVHQQANHQNSNSSGISTRVVLQQPNNLRMNNNISSSNNSQQHIFSSSDGSVQQYSWQNVSAVAPQSNYDQHMYYTSEIFSTASANTDGNHLKTATIIEPQQHQIITQGNVQVKTISGGVGTSQHHQTNHHTEVSSQGNHQINVGGIHQGNVNVLPGTIILSTNSNNLTNLQNAQIISASNINHANSNIVQQIPLVHNQSHSNNSSSIQTSNLPSCSPAKKKKRPVKSKKKQIASEPEFEADIENSIFPDDRVYIRTDDNDKSISNSRHTISINMSNKHDLRAIKLINPRPEYANLSTCSNSGVGPQDSDEDDFKSLTGVGVWEYGKVWNHTLTIKFLEKLHYNKKRMFSRDSRKALYKELSLMFQKDEQKEITIEELEKKWCSLLSSFKRNQIRIKKGEDISWGYYKIMEEILTEGREIRKANRERPYSRKRGRGVVKRLVSDEEQEIRGVKAMCNRKNKKMKKVLSDRLDLIKTEREERIGEAKRTWDDVSKTVSRVNESLSALNSSMEVLGHTLSTFLGNLESLDHEKLNKAVSTFST